MNNKPFAIILYSLLVLTGFAAFQSEACAQILDTYQAGYPIQQRFVVIPGNSRATFRTDTSLTRPPMVSYSDTVLSLVDLSGNYLGGADRWDTSSPECLAYGARGWGPSCFTYENTTPYTKFAWLFGRAWRSAYPASTRLYAEGPGQVNGPMADPLNGNSTAPVFLGGGSFNHTLATSGRQHISTAHQAGNADRHIMLIRHADNNSHAEEVYWYKNGHSNVVYNLAEFDQVGLGVIPTANVGISYGGYGFTNTGPLRILQNDWFVPGSDFDGDGLGHTLEQSLGTCDRPWAGSAGDTMPDGRSCHDLQFCDTRADYDEISTCNAQLRDTDHDGLRDDIEVYGYDNATTHMARYGANPVHTDVFVELNTRDTNPFMPGCQGFTTDLGLGNVQNIGSTGAFFNNVAALYSQAPASMNPDGTQGISVHYDVGVANPNPLTAALWGDWGAGGQCFVGSTYTTLCAANRGVRDWLFVWGIDDNVTNGQTGGSCYTGSNSAVHVHELGHALFTPSHGGPANTSAVALNSSNRRPTYYSRMNYIYQNYAQGVGGVGANWAELSFSVGAGGQSNARDVTEIDPLPGQSLAPLASRGIGTSGSNVDWNDDDVFSGYSNMSQYRNTENARNARGSIEADLQTGIYGTHHDAAIINNMLVYAYVKDGQAYIKANADGECALTPSAVNGDVPSYSDCIGLGTAQSMFISSPDAVSIARAQLPVGGIQGMFAAFRLGTQLYGSFFSLTPLPSLDSQVFVGSESGNTIPTNWPPMDPSVDVTLLDIPDSSFNPQGGLMLFYQDNTQTLRQAFLPGGGVWSDAVAVTDNTGAFPGSVTGDIGAVLHDGVLHLAAPGVGTGGNAVIYTIPLASNQNTQWQQLREVPNTSGATDLELATAPQPTGNPSTELYLFYLDGSNDVMQTRYATTLTGGMLTAGWTDPNQSGVNDQERGLSTIASVYDGRLVTGPATGLRAFRSTHRLCPSNNRTSCLKEGGYWPGRPADLACSLNTPNSWCLAITTYGFQKPSLIKYAPFATGLHPTEFCDYDDWQGLDWGICERRTNDSSPPGDSGLGSVPYNAAVRCRIRPVYPEPTPGGMCVAANPPPASDRSSHQSYY